MVLRQRTTSIQKRIEVILTAIWMSSCSSVAEIQFNYDDPLIEAPTRSISLHLLKGTSCDEVMARTHRSGMNSDNFIRESNFVYPVRNKYLDFSDLESDTSITFTAEAYDRELISIARGCVTQSIQDLQLLNIQLFSLPKCERRPSELDLSIVIDTSSASRNIDPQLQHLDAIKTVFLEPQIFSSWTIITTGGGPKQLVTRSPNIERIETAFDEISADYKSDTNQLFDGITLAAKMARANALCGRRPAILIYTSGADQGSILNLRNANLGLKGSSVDPGDDIYSVGFSFDQKGFSQMLDIIPENSGSFVLGNHPQFFEQQFFEVREELQALIQP